MGQISILTILTILTILAILTRPPGHEPTGEQGGLHEAGGGRLHLPAREEGCVGLR
jgi:hypothetical protein